MGQLQAWKILQRTTEKGINSDDFFVDLNDVKYDHLAERAKRDIENPNFLSLFDKHRDLSMRNYLAGKMGLSAHDNVTLGMINVWNMLELAKQEADLNPINISQQIRECVDELEDKTALDEYDSVFGNLEEDIFFEDMK